MIDNFEPVVFANCASFENVLFFVLSYLFIFNYFEKFTAF